MPSPQRTRRRPPLPLRFTASWQISPDGNVPSELVSQAPPWPRRLRDPVSVFVGQKAVSHYDRCSRDPGRVESATAFMKPSHYRGVVVLAATSRQSFLRSRAGILTAVTR